MHRMQSLVPGALVHRNRPHRSLGRGDRLRCSRRKWGPECIPLEVLLWTCRKSGQGRDGTGAMDSTACAPSVSRCVVKECLHPMSAQTVQEGSCTGGVRSRTRGAHHGLQHPTTARAVVTVPHVPGQRQRHGKFFKMPVGRGVPQSTGRNGRPDIRHSPFGPPPPRNIDGYTLAPAARAGGGPPRLCTGQTAGGLWSAGLVVQHVQHRHPLRQQHFSGQEAGGGGGWLPPFRAFVTDSKS